MNTNMQTVLLFIQMLKLLKIRIVGNHLLLILRHFCVVSK